MGAGDVFETFSSWFNSLALLLQQNIQWPSYITTIKAWIQAVFRFEFTDSMADILPNFINAIRNIRIEFRYQFILICILVPLLITLTALILFKPVYVVLWYFFTLISLVTIFAGIVTLVLPKNQVTKAVSDVNFGLFTVPLPVVILVSGIIAFLICVALFLTFHISKIIIRKRKELKAKKQQVHPEPNPENLTAEEIKKKKIAEYKRMVMEKRNKKFMALHQYRKDKELAMKFSFLKFIRSIILGALLIVLMLFVTRTLKLSYFGIPSIADESYYTAIQNIFIPVQVVGWIVFAVGILIVFHSFIIIFPKGRSAMYFIRIALRRNFLSLIFTVLTAIFTPILTLILSSFVCVPRTCGVGTQFPSKINTLSLNSITAASNSTGICQACTFHPNNNCTIINDLCPGASSLRLYSDPSLMCTRDIMPFFWPSSFFVFIGFILGIPALFWYLTRISVKSLETFDVEILMEKNMNPEIKKKIEEIKKRKKNKKKKHAHLEEEKPGEEKTIVKKIEPQQPMQQTSVQLQDIPSSQDVTQNGANSQQAQEGSAPSQYQEDMQKPIASSSPRQPLVPVSYEPEPDSAQVYTVDDSQIIATPSALYKRGPSLFNVAGSLDLKNLSKLNFREKRKVAKENAERWIIRTGLSNVPISSIYHSYEYRWRYYRLFSMVYKVLHVAAAICLVTVPQAGLPVILGFHTIACGVQILTRPFIVGFEDFLASIAAILTVINAIFTVIVLFLPNAATVIPSYVYYIIIGVNIVLPVMALILAIASLCSRRNTLKKYSLRMQAIDEYAKENDLQNKYNISKMKQNHIDVDNSLTSASLGVIVNFFLVFGVLLFIGLAIAILGVVFDELNPTYIPGTDLNLGTQETCQTLNQMHFAGYSSWEEFTSNCCCIESWHHNGTLINDEKIFKSVEMWQCKNGVRKERVRWQYLTDFDVEASGFDIRPLCGTVLHSNYTISNCTTGSVTAQSSYTPTFSGTEKEQQDASLVWEYTLLYLW